MASESLDHDPNLGARPRMPIDDVIDAWRKNGGPAFPTPSWRDNSPQLQSFGLSLRDAFAGLALLGYISTATKDEQIQENEMGPFCYRIADAMLKAREKEHN